MSKVSPSQPDKRFFRDVFDASPVGVAVEDVEGQPLFVNPAFCSFLGFTEEELRRKHCVDFSPQEDAEKDWALFQQLRAGAIDHYQMEKRYFRRDGSLVWGRLNLSLLGHNPSPLVLAMVEDITEKKAAEETLAEMIRKLIEAQEQERARIGRELHDDINQRLAMFSLELELLKENPSEVESRAQGLQKRLFEISDDVQALSHDLHSTKLEYLGVVAGVKSWCKEFAERQKMDVDFRNDVRSVLPLDVGRPLFRILQEALHNASKYSGVKRIEVQLREESGEIHLIVRDSGKGFDIEAALQGKGIGLTSMRERVRLVNGTVSIQSKPMGGTTIHVRVPLGLSYSSQRPAG